MQFSASIAPQTVVTSNAGNAVTNGMEAAVTYKPAPGLTIDFHATVLDAKYVSFAAYSVPTNLKVFLPSTTLNSSGQPIGKGLYTDLNGNSNLYNASGNKIVNAPPVSLSLAVQKDFDLANGADLFFRGEYEYQGQVFFDPTNAAVDSQAAYSIVNGSIGYSPAHSHWTVSVWGKNMADTRYIVGAQSGGGCLRRHWRPPHFRTSRQLHLLIQRHCRIEYGLRARINHAIDAGFILASAIRSHVGAPCPVLITSLRAPLNTIYRGKITKQPFRD